MNAKTFTSTHFLQYYPLEKLKKAVRKEPFHIATQLNGVNLFGCTKFKEGQVALKKFYSLPLPEQRKYLEETLSKTFLIPKGYTLPIAKIKREAFVPENKRILTYWNDVTWIEGLCGLTPPWVSCLAGNWLEIKPGGKVFVIGSALGCLTAYFSELVGEKGKVFATEIEEKYANKAKSILDELGYKNIETIKADGVFGWPDKNEKFDAIWPTLSTRTVPKAWKEQLKEGGIMGCFLPFSETEFKQAPKNFSWWSKYNYKDYQDYLTKWWENLQLKIFRKEKRKLIEIRTMYRLFNPPLFNKEYGSCENIDWMSIFNKREEEILKFLRK